MRWILAFVLLIGCAYKPKIATEDVKVMLQAAQTFKHRVNAGFYGGNPQLQIDAYNLLQTAHRAYKSHIKTRCYVNQPEHP